MSRFRWRFGHLVVVFAAAAAGPLALALTGSAAARPAAEAARCSLKAKPLSPQIVSPCNHATVTSGQTLTFKVRDLNPKAHKYRPFFNLTAKPPKGGILKTDTSANGYFREMRKAHGKGMFSITPKLYTFPGYWLVTPGTYYIQIQQVDCSVKKCTRYSPVETITVR